MLSISAVLPAYNEEQVIASSVAAMVQTLESLGADYEVIVVNDGSRDRTAEILTKLGEENPRIRMVSHAQNQGYGARSGTGFTSATKELVFLTDGDKQFDVDELEDFLPLLDGADLVIGFREPRADPLIRRLNGWGWNSIVTLLFGYTAKDVDCAFKLFRRRILDRVDVHARGATFSAEFLIKARRLGVRDPRAARQPLPTAGRSGDRRQAGRDPAGVPRAFAAALQPRKRSGAGLPRT